MALAAALLTVKPSRADAPFAFALVPSSGVIDRAGYYGLEADRTVSGQIGIDVVAPNVTINLRQHRLKLKTSRHGGQGITIGIRVMESDVVVVNGAVEGFTIGLKQGASEGLTVDSMTFANSGAVGIEATGDNTTIRRTVIDGVGGQPLDVRNAYAIGANLRGRFLVFENNVVRKVERQALPETVAGESVGILLGEESDNVRIAQNRIEKGPVGGRSIGLWSAARGPVLIYSNAVTGFNDGIVLRGWEALAYRNRLNCTVGVSTGIVISQDLHGGFRQVGVFGNSFSGCALEQIDCRGGCGESWKRVTAERAAHVSP